MNYLRTKATDLKRTVNLKKGKGKWAKRSFFPLQLDSEQNYTNISNKPIFAMKD